jgi:hypothetical protein
MIRAIAPIRLPPSEKYHPIRGASLIKTSLFPPSLVVTLIALPSLFLGRSVLASVLLHLASISALKFEALKKGKIQKQGVKGES